MECFPDFGGGRKQKQLNSRLIVTGGDPNQNLEFQIDIPLILSICQLLIDGKSNNFSNKLQEFSLKVLQEFII